MGSVGSTAQPHLYVQCPPSGLIQLRLTTSGKNLSLFVPKLQSLIGKVQNKWRLYKIQIRGQQEVRDKV